MLRLLVLCCLLWALPSQATERRVKVAVVDTGIRSSFPKEALCEDAPGNTSGVKAMNDREDHGTTMACIIMHDLDYRKVCIWPIKYFDRWGGSQAAAIEAFRMVLASDAKYLNFSSVGYYYSEEEHRLIREMVKHGITITAAAGNEHANLDETCRAYPACLIQDPQIKASGRFHAVGALTPDGQYASYSNRGAMLTDKVVVAPIQGCEFVQGTSPAAAMVMNGILKSKGLGKH